MAKLVLSKSALQKQRENMRLYERILPSLDLKLMQLAAALKRAQQQLTEVKSKEKMLGEGVSLQLPMLADREMALSGLVKVESIDIQEENMGGVKLPRLVDVRCRIAAYSMLARPQWVDTLVDHLQKMVTQKALVHVTTQRVRLLEQAVRKVTQRNNLFEKILIPQARSNIRKIQIYLADADRAAVVRSKITKSIRRKQAEAFLRAAP